MGNTTAVGPRVGGSAATLLLNLVGLEVAGVAADEGGARSVELVTADPAAAACPGWCSPPR